jgi:hypothetical protein
MVREHGAHKGHEQAKRGCKQTKHYHYNPDRIVSAAACPRVHDHSQAGLSDDEYLHPDQERDSFEEQLRQL